MCRGETTTTTMNSTYKFEVEDGTMLRYTYKGVKQYGHWQSATKKVLYFADGGFHTDSLNKFAKNHIKAINPSRRTCEVNPWQVCEFKIGGSWRRSQPRRVKTAPHERVALGEWTVRTYTRKSGKQQGQEYHVYEGPGGTKYRSKKTAQEAADWEEIVWSGEQ